ncbi:MAG: DUF4250 domain-containing protein [Eubacteriales bacterium]|nr:DUF4250 domain-containing protein [Eubacteriales bacterium]
MIPKDPIMLLSYVNTMLRDKYSSVKELCRACGVEEEEIHEKLKTVDYEYDESSNQFI